MNCIALAGNTHTLVDVAPPGLHLSPGNNHLQTRWLWKENGTSVGLVQIQVSKLPRCGV
jgi:hypothetical protein